MLVHKSSNDIFSQRFSKFFLHAFTLATRPMRVYQLCSQAFKSRLTHRPERDLYIAALMHCDLDTLHSCTAILTRCTRALQWGVQMEERRLRDSRSILEKARLERARAQELKHAELQQLEVSCLCFNLIVKNL
jgi:hypothetical protein